MAKKKKSAQEKIAAILEKEIYTQHDDMGELYGKKTATWKIMQVVRQEVRKALADTEPEIKYVTRERRRSQYE